MWSNQKMVLIKIDPLTKIYILTKFHKNSIINEGDTGFRRKSEGEKNQKQPYLG